jgi:hypothetical protein
VRKTIRSLHIAIVVTLGVTGSITSAPAWQTRYYREAWLDQCVKTSTQEQCNAGWDNLIARNDAIGLICSLSSKRVIRWIVIRKSEGIAAGERHIVSAVHVLPTNPYIRYTG